MILPLRSLAAPHTPTHRAEKELGLPAPVLRLPRPQPESTSPRRPARSVPRLHRRGGARAASTPPSSARRCLIRPCVCLSSQVLSSFKTKDRVFSIWSPRGQMGHGSEPSQVTESVSVAPQTAPRRAGRGSDPGQKRYLVSRHREREELGVSGLGRVLTLTTQAGLSVPRAFGILAFPLKSES